MTIRSGRFKGNTLVSNPLTVVMSAKEGGVYRFFNSGSQSFIIQGGKSDVTLEPRLTVDIGVNKSELKISASDDTDNAEGIYDLLTVDRAVRSGRFTLAAPNSTSTVAPHTVIEFVNHSNLDGKIYRFFNSSDDEVSFKIVGSKSGLNKELASGLSIDIEVERDEKITVEGTNNGEKIEGIYEFLGAGS